jgi:hypothetical protein
VCVRACVRACACVLGPIKMMDKLRKFTTKISVAVALHISETNSSQARVHCVITSPNRSLFHLELRVPLVHANSHQTSTPHKISSILIDILQLIRWIRSSAQWCTRFMQFCAWCSNAPRVCARRNKTNMVDTSLLANCEYYSTAVSWNSIQGNWTGVHRYIGSEKRFESKLKTWLSRQRYNYNYYYIL